MNRHPGALLQDLLTAQGMTQVELCRRTELSPKHISQVINGLAGIGATAALRFESVLGVPAEVFIFAQAQHDLAAARAAIVTR